MVEFQIARAQTSILVSEVLEILGALLGRLDALLFVSDEHGQLLGVLLQREHFIVVVYGVFPITLQLLAQFSNRGLGLLYLDPQSRHPIRELLCPRDIAGYFLLLSLQVPRLRLVLQPQAPRHPPFLRRLVLYAHYLRDLVLVLQAIPHVLDLLGEVIALPLAFLDLVALYLQVLEQALVLRGLLPLLLEYAPQLLLHLVDDGGQLLLEGVVDVSDLLDISIRYVVLIVRVVGLPVVILVVGTIAIGLVVEVHYLNFGLLRILCGHGPSLVPR